MDDISVELEVIQSVGSALARLSDPEAQRRVIRWINDRFQQNERPVATNRREPGAPAFADQVISDDELSDLFERPGQKPAMHREMGNNPDAPTAARLEPEPEVGIDSLMKGFVADFQRVALEWQRA